MGKKKQEEYEEDLNTIWEKYISPAYKSGTSYFVKDISNCCDNEVEYIILSESPHKDEVEHKDTIKNAQPLPLVGDSGKAVSEFLFGKSVPIGELVDEKSATIPCKLAIVNVCNVPLQEIEENKNDVKGMNLDYLRDNCRVIPDLKENLKGRLKKYKNAHKIIVCGEFAQAYYDELKNDFNTIKSLYVPHPARNHWQFVYDHKDDISTLKWLFKK